WQAFGTLLLAMALGAWAQYLLVRGLGRPALDRVGRYLGLPPARLDRAVAAVRRGGVATLAVGLATPGVRIAIVPACALARLPYRTFLPGVLAGSGLFLALHFALGYAGGSPAGAAPRRPGLPLLAARGGSALAGLGRW